MAANSPLLLAQTPPAQSNPHAQTAAPATPSTTSTPAPPQTAPGADPAPPPSIDEVSYLFGLTFGAQLRGAGVTGELSTEAITRGIKDSMNGKEPTSADMQQLQAYVRNAAQAAAARNRAAATDYLERNSHEKGVITTPSGLQYKVLSPGDKKAPTITASDQVTVQYRGHLLDGTEFDSSYARGMPATFPVTGVIKGWQEALVLMKPGSKYRLFVPPDLAYGSVPRPKIPAGSLLIFEVEVVSAQPAGAAAPKPPAAAPKAAAPKPPQTTTPSTP
jgi:FKBP-type peptidyl-prolyl cis-trans isomerase